MGNKIDREDREIPTHVGEDFAQQHGMYFLETSAKEAENVERLFMEIAAELMEVSKHCFRNTFFNSFFAIFYIWKLICSKQGAKNYQDTNKMPLP